MKTSFISPISAVIFMYLFGVTNPYILLIGALVSFILDVVLTSIIENMGFKGILWLGWILALGIGFVVPAAITLPHVLNWAMSQVNSIK